MKRIILKFATLLILVIAGIFIQENSPVNAVLYCWETAMNKWQACDGGYGETVSRATVYYNNSNYYCDNNSVSNCSASAHNYCSTQANTTCSGDPEYPTCYNNSYNSCYLANYQSCHTSTYQSCLDNVNASYNNRGSAYVSCMYGQEGNGNICVEQTNSCTEARARANDCYSLYSEDDSGALTTCMDQSGVWQCQ